MFKNGIQKFVSVVLDTTKTVLVSAVDVADTALKGVFNVGKEAVNTVVKNYKKDEEKDNVKNS
jgi:hypothetical protein